MIKIDKDKRIRKMRLRVFINDRLRKSKKKFKNIQ